jgi:hypothetical protein
MWRSRCRTQPCHTRTPSLSPRRFMYSNILQKHACLPFYILSFTKLIFFPSGTFEEKNKAYMIACLFPLHCIMDFNITSGRRNSVQETNTTLALLWPPDKASEDILRRHQSIRGTPDVPRSTKFHIYDGYRLRLSTYAARAGLHDTPVWLKWLWLICGLRQN